MVAPSVAPTRVRMSSRKGPDAPERVSEPSLFVVEGREHADVVCAGLVGCAEQGVQACEDRREVVHAPRCEEGVVEPEARGGGGVSREDVVADDLVAAQAGQAREETEEVGLRPVADAVDRLRVPLAVEGQTVVRVAVEVDRELRDPQERPGPHEDLATVGRDEATGEPRASRSSQELSRGPP